MSKRFTIGSRAFFTGMEGFAPSDTDILILEDEPNGYKVVRQLHFANNCEYRWKRMSAEEFINYALTKGPAMQLGKFLVPAFAEEIGLTIGQLEQLQPLVDKLDAKHKYEACIYAAYLENGSFTLSETQRKAAYEAYKAARLEKDKYGHAINE